MILPQLVISILLFLVLFFGIGFILNMLFRSTWFLAVVYPIIVIFIIDDVKFYEYATETGNSFGALGQQFVDLQTVDVVILTSGLTGAIVAGVAIRMLRVRGYQMF
jgi:hypothetical protein